MARPYVVDIAGGTATATVQIQGSQTLRTCYLSYLNAAAGKIELSRSSVSQIGTAQPTSDVIARASVGSSGQSNVIIPINVPVKVFDNIYVHCTGAGNLGTATLA
jgi:hypothetical protein